MSAWSNLPNAYCIDQVIESVKENLEIWVEVWDAFRDMASNAIWGAATAAVRDADRAMVLDAVWIRISDRGAAGDAAWGAIMALIAYDDSSKYLAMPSDQLQFHAILSEDPAAILLLPSVIAFEKINELESTVS
jgi:hypothetical protein